MPNVIGPDKKPRSLTVNEDGELLVTGAGGGGGGGATEIQGRDYNNADALTTPSVYDNGDGRKFLLTTDDFATEVLNTIQEGIGESADAAVSPGAAGSLNAKLRTATDQLDNIDVNTTVSASAGVALADAIGDQYETVAASATNQALGGTGAVGDYLAVLLCVVSTASTAQVSIKDGSDGAIVVFPANPGAGVGTYPIPLGLTSRTGAWQITTGAGVAVIATGRFTP